MSDLISVLVTTSLFGVFGVIHSILASIKIKSIVYTKYPKILPFYRLFYNIMSLILFTVVFWVSPKSDTIVYDLVFPFDLLVLIPQFLGVLGLFWTFRNIDIQEFLGIAQIKRYLKKGYNVMELDEHKTLRIAGPYKYSRHPLYFFSIVFLLFRPYMTLFYFTMFLCILTYFYFGSVYEERKLMDAFGNSYLEYTKRVPRIFPNFFIKGDNI